MGIPINVLKIEHACEDVSQVLKSLAHPRRLLVLGHLLNGSKSVNELVELCDVSQPQMSHFLKTLSQEDLIQCERDGRQRIYSIRDMRLRQLLLTIQKEYCGGKK